MARSPLWDDPKFVSDCLNRPKKEVMADWGVSSGLVVDVKKEHGGKVDESRTKDGAPSLKDGETTDITDGPNGRQFNFIRHRPVTLEDARDLIRSTGDNPDHYNIGIKSIAYGDGKSSNRITAWPKTGVSLAETFPLSHFYAEAEKRPQSRVGGRPAQRGTVVTLADWQVGKTGRRGGTVELLQRLEDARQKLDEEFAARRPERILILDGGDGLEGFESGGNPMHTNDLSLPDQLDCYATEMFKFIEMAHRYAPVEIAIVPSNHSAWRRGKQNLGRPSDDLGIFVHRQVAKVADAAGLDATWHFPDEYDESICVDFYGTPIGLVHGNQFGPGKAIDWWTQQAFGDQAVTRADVCVTAHYHSFGAGVAGQNPFTKRERMWLGAPTLDSGSDWYRNIKGRDSLPGTMIFDVLPETGFDLGSLKIV